MRLFRKYLKIPHSHFSLIIGLSLLHHPVSQRKNLSENIISLHIFWTSAKKTDTAGQCQKRCTTDADSIERKWLSTELYQLSLSIYFTGTMHIFFFFHVYHSWFCVFVYNPNKVGINEGLTCLTGYHMWIMHTDVL